MCEAKSYHRDLVLSHRDFHISNLKRILSFGRKEVVIYRKKLILGRDLTGTGVY
jgi:hypothetical protein